MSPSWKQRQPYPGGPLIYTAVTDEEAAELRRLAVGKRAVETGTGYGFSAIAMASVARSVVTVDHHKWIADGLSTTYFHLNQCHLTRKVMVIVEDSREFLPMLRDETFDMFFIDGGHKVHEVLFDAQQAERLVRRGGTIAFHDYRHDDPDLEVAQVIDERYGLNAGRLVGSLFILDNWQGGK